MKLKCAASVRLLSLSFFWGGGGQKVVVTLDAIGCLENFLETRPFRRACPSGWTSPGLKSPSFLSGKGNEAL